MASPSLVFLKIKASARNIVKVLLKPQYLFFAIFAGLAVLAVILWSLNIDLLYFIFFQSGISLWDKVTFFTSVYGGIFTSAEDLQAFSMIIFSTLFGINASMVLFVFKNKKQEKAVNGHTAAGLSFAVLGGGCVACGTSIFAPLLVSFGATGAATFLSEIGVFLNLAASAFMLWSLYKLGLSIGSIFAKA